MKTQLTKIPSLPHIVPGVLSGEATSETIAIDLIKNNKDLPKSQKDITIFLKSRTFSKKLNKNFHLLHVHE